MDGAMGPQARKSSRFAELLAERISRPVHLWDESFSSVAADVIMRESGVGRGRKKGRRDSVAAAVILQEYLKGMCTGPEPTAKG